MLGTQIRGDFLELAMTRLCLTGMANAGLTT